MTEKNEALIRSALKDGCRAHCDALIGELRRLQEEITQIRHATAATNRCIADLAAQRYELLDALKMAVRQNEHDMVMTGEECRQCRAAIKAVEGEKT